MRRTANDQGGWFLPAGSGDGQLLRRSDSRCDERHLSDRALHARRGGEPDRPVPCWFTPSELSQFTCDRTW
jgi:hypothetical protein